MTKAQIRILIPLVCIAALLVYTFCVHFTDHSLETLIRHYLALGLFVPLVRGFIKKQIRLTVIYTGLYLLLATFNLLVITPTINHGFWIKIGSVTIDLPSFNGRAFGVLALYLMLNFDALIDFYLDYKESRKQKKG
ncbi:MAG: hypothetical protein J7621_15615 [Niastella sp.]|nr:hypothetical protein [Niastella sp.]